MKHTILIVDDEIDVLNSLKRQLRNEPFELMFAGSGKEALNLIEKGSIHVILTDYKMPAMNGVELLQTVKQRHPEIVRAIFSGFIDMGVLVGSINKGEVYRFITKPWDAQKLKELLHTSIEHFDILAKNKQFMKEIIAKNESLSKTVGERGRALDLSDAILDALPFAVIAVDNEMNVIKTNSMARSILPVEKDAASAKKLSSLMPDLLTDFISSGLDTCDGQDVGRFSIGENDYTVRLRKLRQGIDSAKGLIIIHE